MENKVKVRAWFPIISCYNSNSCCLMETWEALPRILTSSADLGSFTCCWSWLSDWSIKWLPSQATILSYLILSSSLLPHCLCYLSYLLCSLSAHCPCCLFFPICLSPYPRVSVFVSVSSMYPPSARLCSLLSSLSPAHLPSTGSLSTCFLLSLLPSSVFSALSSLSLLERIETEMVGDLL